MAMLCASESACPGHGLGVGSIATNLSPSVNASGWWRFLEQSVYRRQVCCGRSLRCHKIAGVVRLLSCTVAKRPLFTHFAPTAMAEKDAMSYFINLLISTIYTPMPCISPTQVLLVGGSARDVRETQAAASTAPTCNGRSNMQNNTSFLALKKN